MPLLESMRFRLPVVAYDAAAVGETVGHAGVLLSERDLAEAAEAAAIVNERTELREQLIAAGERRIADFDPDKVAMGRVYFCEHQTPDLVWRPEWQRHPNGACAIARVVVATADPQRTAALYS